MQTLLYAVILSAFLACISMDASAEGLGYYLPSNITYNPSIPSPQSFFGFEVGEWHLRHDQLIAYLEALDKASDRIALERYGVTYEQRPLVLVTITHADNHAKLEDIQHEQREGVMSGSSSASKHMQAPVVVWLGYTIHGNEASGTNAACLVAYYLAAATGAAVEQQLASAVILLDPCMNPDGYGRFATWVNSNRSQHPVADPATREHMEAWPGGRGNHYWFDLNRDYIPLVHPESRARVEQYHRWMPHLFFDFHEMGTSSSYFFQPGKPSAIHPLIPERNQVLTRRLAGRFAGALDSLGSLYYTEEVFDDFFAGKGSTYTDLTGSVGILFEQASVRGHRQERVDGTLTFPYAIRNHVVSSLTILNALPEMREELLDYRQTFFAQSREDARQSPVRAYIFGSSHDPLRSRQLADLLTHHNIRVHELRRQYTVGKMPYEPGAAFIVDVLQPHYRLLTALLEQRTSFQDSIFYDISAWTLPHAYGLQFAPLTTLPGDLQGDPVVPARPQSGSYTGPAHPVAYMIPWGQVNAPRVLYRLLRAGIRVRTAMKPFAAGTDANGDPRQFDNGTLVVPVGVQRDKADTIAACIHEATRRDGLAVYGVESGLTARGIDLGSDYIRSVHMPRVLLAAGTGVSGSEAGELWHLLDLKLGVDVTVADPAQFGRIDLSRYTVLLLPGGTYAQTDSVSVSAIRDWVERGGILVAQESAAEWLSRKKISSVIVRSPRDLQKDTTLVRRPYGDMGKAEGAQLVGGVIVEARVDRSHPLAYGIDTEKLALCHGTSLVLIPPRDPYATPLSYTENPVLSGYLSPQNKRNLAGSAAVAVTAAGKGCIVHFMDHAAFRGFWLGSERLLVNAVFFGPLLRPQPSRGDR